MAHRRHGGSSVEETLTMYHERAVRATRSLRILEMYALGMPVDLIAADFRCSRGTVLRHARQAGMAKRQRGLGEELLKLADKLIKEGRPLLYIAKRLNRSEAWVSHRAAKLKQRRYTTRKGKRNAKAHRAYTEARANVQRGRAGGDGGGPQEVT